MKCCKLILLTLNHNSKDQVSCDFDQAKVMRPPFVVYFGKDLCGCSSGGGEVGLLTAQVVFHGRTASSLNLSCVSCLGTSPATLSVPVSMAGLHFDPQLWTALPASDCAWPHPGIPPQCLHWICSTKRQYLSVPYMGILVAHLKQNIILRSWRTKFLSVHALSSSQSLTHCKISIHSFHLSGPSVLSALSAVTHFSRSVEFQQGKCSTNSPEIVMLFYKPGESGIRYF